MDLKELLGEELAEQVKPKIGDNHILIDKSEGEWLPKEKFNTVNNENKDLKQRIQDRDDQLDKLQKQAKGNDDLQQTIKDLQKENDDAKKEYEDQLAQTRKESKLEIALKDAKAKNPKAVKALLNNDAISLDGDNLLGLEEQLKGLQESDAYLFGEDEPPGLKGRQPHPSNNGGGSGESNPFSKDSFNLTEQGKMVRDDPEKARQLISQAGGNPANFGL